MPHRIRTTGWRSAVNEHQKHAKQLASLQDDATLEEIKRHAYVLEKIQRGLADVEAGRTCTTEQARKRLEKWLAH